MLILNHNEHRKMLSYLNLIELTYVRVYKSEYSLSKIMLCKLIKAYILIEFNSEILSFKKEQCSIITWISLQTASYFISKIPLKRTNVLFISD